MSHRRHFAIAAALAASRIIPRDWPVLGSLVRSSLMTFSAGAALTFAFVKLSQDQDGHDGGAPGESAAELPYEEWARDELYQLAQQYEIEGRSRMNKQELILALRELDQGEAETAE